MTNAKTTRKALLGSILSLLLCFTMLLSTTFAWFTDTVTSANNKIMAGNLDVQLWMADSDGDYSDISDAISPIFGAGSLAQNDNAATLWEPGKTQVAYLAIKNAGSLDLKYKVDLKVVNPDDGKDLYKVMKYAIVADATPAAPVTGWTEGLSVLPGVNATQAKNVVLEADAIHYFALVIHMEETAGNEYQGGQVNFDICVQAAQLASEEDSFGADYDELASYNGSGMSKLNTGDSAVEVTVYSQNATTGAMEKMGTATVPAEAVADPSKPVETKMEPSNYEGNFSVSVDSETLVLDIDVTNLKENNNVPVKINVFIGENLDPATVKLYHYSDEIACTYNPNTGYVTFESATFSPFTVVYDKESKYKAPEADESKLPTATVTEYDLNKTPGYATGEGAPVWGSYGQWSPTAGLDSKLEAAYTFACQETLEDAKVNPYANWYCDFYVKLDKDLGENQIFLGGNYGSFGWVGFHNGELTLEANTEIPLLGSVTSNPWTYLDVVQNVGTFICGVGDVNDALADATFTVMLRLTNPDNENDFVNVATINYTFAKTVTTGEELQDAVNNGSENIVLGNDIDLSNGGIVIPGN